MTKPLGVGILGAGAATQAIHLPTLARQPDRFRVVSVMDVDAAAAESVAARADARPTTRLEAVLDDPAVDVVAVCSPSQFHAAQVTASCAAGKRGILCEKPLATSSAELAQITEAVTSAGIPLVVGAMHAYDPGWLAALEVCADSLGAAHAIRSTIVLPFNDRFENWATEIARRPPPPRPSGPLDPAGRAARRRGRGLAPGDAGVSVRGAVTVAGADDARFSRELRAVLSSLPRGSRSPGRRRHPCRGPGFRGVRGRCPGSGRFGRRARDSCRGGVGLGVPSGASAVRGPRRPSGSPALFSSTASRSSRPRIRVLRPTCCSTNLPCCARCPARSVVFALRPATPRATRSAQSARTRAPSSPCRPCAVPARRRRRGWRCTGRPWRRT